MFPLEKTAVTTVVPVAPPCWADLQWPGWLAGGQHLILFRSTQLGANLCLFLDLSDAILVWTEQSDI